MRDASLLAERTSGPPALVVGGGGVGLPWRCAEAVAVLPLVVVGLLGCSSKPPPDYAPDPVLIERIAEIRMSTPRRVCPGQTIQATYEAVLEDGMVIPFARKYDKDHPPSLHVVFLRLWSREADAEEDGDWDTEPHPLVSATEGFRLHAQMRARPTLAASMVVEPAYHCTRNAFRFAGASGRRGQPGMPGPDVTVRLNVLSSPFYERLLVASIEVGRAPPFYVFADADDVPPSDWLVIESRGGRGGRGFDGDDGAGGQSGTDGCPGGPGGAGGAGDGGGPGGAGGPGGSITVIAPSEEQYLAGIVDAYSAGGEGGHGGKGGSGGKGGEGGKGTVDSERRRCTNGSPGADGPDGREGQVGADGPSGYRAQVLTVPAADVFGRRVHPVIQELVDYTSGRGRLPG